MKKELSKYFSKIGRRGGRVSSPAKTEANRLRAIARWERVKCVKKSDKVSGINTTISSRLASTG